mgnify:CR=1 FL=1
MKNFGEPFVFDDVTIMENLGKRIANFQGKGIGAALYSEVEKLSDATWFALEVNTKPRNEGSLRFHAREGFVQMEELETRPGKMVSLMVKKLKG